MGTLAMKKIVGVALSSERKQLLTLLTKFGCIEIDEPKEVEGMTRLGVGEESDAAELNLASIAFAVDMIKKCRIEAKSLVKNKEFEYKRDKPPLIERKPEIEYDEFVSLGAREDGIFKKIASLQELNDELIELKANEIKANAIIDSVKSFTDFKLKLSRYRDTKRTVIRMGLISARNVEEFAALKDNFQSLELEYFVCGNVAAAALVALREEWSEITSQLEKFEFSELNTLEYNDTAENILKAEQVNLKLMSERRKDIVRTVAKDFDTKEFISELKLFEDYYRVNKQLADSEKLMLATDKAYLFEAWLPSGATEKISGELDKSEFKISYFIRDPEEGEQEPTLIENNAVVTPYQSVTNMYSVPNAHEINPNPFVCFFFIVFFGMMLGDAGYGLLIALATGIYLAIAKPRKNELSLIKILFMGGISTMVWGVLFNSYFGLDIMPWQWFKPIEEPMTMLILSLGLGLLQMMTGIAINAYSLFKQHKPLDAICGAFSWYAIVIGIAMFVLGSKNAGVKYAGIAFLVVGFALLMLSGAIHKRGAKKISGAFGALYGLINFISDLLSYSRLFGLGLATGVIASVFNQMAGVFIGLNPYIGSIIAVVLIVVGHLFNIAINTLGAYVHNSRLQYVEFFNKFYEGEGRLFRPLGSEMKNYNFVQQEEQKS